LKRSVVACQIQAWKMGTPLTPVSKKCWPTFRLNGT
jgi:hypothetical protein